MLITTKEVAALLRVHPKHVYRLLKRGLPAHRVGDEWRFDETAVLRWARLAPGPSMPSPSAPEADAPPVRAPLKTASVITAPLLAGNGDVALEALLEELALRGAPLLGHVQADHATGLELLGRGAVLLAGCHGEAAPSETSGDAAAPAISGKLAFIHLVNRELGLAFRRGLRARRASIIVGRSFASRPLTAGIRRRLDEVLRGEGIDPAEAHRGAELHPSHRDAVMAVLRGEAEIALATRAWAVRAGLGFLPLASEGYGLLLAAESLGDGRVVALGEIAQSAAFRRRLSGELGYDARRTGEIRLKTASASR